MIREDARHRLAAGTASQRGEAYADLLLLLLIDSLPPIPA